MTIELTGCDHSWELILLIIAILSFLLSSPKICSFCQMTCNPCHMHYWDFHENECYTSGNVVIVCI